MHSVEFTKDNILLPRYASVCIVLDETATHLFNLPTVIFFSVGNFLNKLAL